jgi:NAD dependent epimerase/dehydratase family enzyme
MVIAGSKVSSNKIQKAGFTFTFPTVELALTDLLYKKESTEVA